MTTMRLSIAALTSVALLAGSSLALGQPRPAPPAHRHDVRRPMPPPQRGAAQRAAEEHRRADREHQRADREHQKADQEEQRADQEHQRAVKEHRWGEAEKKRAEAWRDKYLKQLGRDRVKRRARQKAAEEKKWGKKMWNHPDVKKEMELDAWRLARIDALVQLATAEKRTDILSRLNKLRATEVQRHNRLMQGYRARWGH